MYWPSSVRIAMLDHQPICKMVTLSIDSVAADAEKLMRLLVLPALMISENVAAEPRAVPDVPPRMASRCRP
jgi:hypothetical protein